MKAFGMLCRTLIFACAPLIAAAEEKPAEAKLPDYSKPAGICELISKAADQYGLPKPFFARLIWKESRFDIKAVSPVGAQGVAQFMPYTAKERGLKDPFDPVQAIPASASYLKHLKGDLGTWGLAAAAYNAGPDRVSRWLAGRSGLPAETRDYIYSITKRPAEWFRDKSHEVEDHPLLKDASFEEGCVKLRVIETRSNPLPRWSVAVAGGRTQGAARSAFNRARVKARGQIDAGRLVIMRNRNKGGPRYLAVLSTGSRNEARKLCLRIRAAKVACRVHRR